MPFTGKSLLYTGTFKRSKKETKVSVQEILQTDAKSNLVALVLVGTVYTLFLFIRPYLEYTHVYIQNFGQPCLEPEKFPVLPSQHDCVLSNPSYHT